MPEGHIEITISIDTADPKQHLEVSNYIKTIVHLLDMTIEEKNEGNDFVAHIEGAHQDSYVQVPQEANPLRALL